MINRTLFTWNLHPKTLVDRQFVMLHTQDTVIWFIKLKYTS